MHTLIPYPHIWHACEGLSVLLQTLGRSELSKYSDEEGAQAFLNRYYLECDGSLIKYEINQKHIDGPSPRLSSNMIDQV